MKRSIRLFMLLLISLMLPVNGMAQTLMGLGSAPTSELSASASLHAGHAPHGEHDAMNLQDARAMHDMCNNCTDSNQTGNSLVCESGQECKTSSLLHRVSSEPTAVPSARSLSVFTSDFLPASVADAVWHPPRS